MTTIELYSVSRDSLAYIKSDQFESRVEVEGRNLEETL